MFDIESVESPMPSGNTEVIQKSYRRSLLKGRYDQERVAKMRQKLMIGFESKLQSLPLLRPANSVTLCRSKKKPNFFQKLPKKQPMQFLQQSEVFQNSSKNAHQLGILLLYILLPRTLKKSPNLVTLPTKDILHKDRRHLTTYQRLFFASCRLRQTRSRDCRELFF